MLTDYASVRIVQIDQGDMRPNGPARDRKEKHKMKTVSDLQALTASDIETATKNGMTEAQMKGCKVAQWDRRIVSDPEVLKVFANREASLAAFDRIANLANDGQEFVSYTDKFIATLKSSILES